MRFARWVAASAVGVIAAACAAVVAVEPASASDPTQTNYSLGVLVLKYFPLTTNGQNIDINVTGDVGDPVASIRTKTDSITTNAINALQAGSTYHGYANTTATRSLTYHVVDTKEIDQAVPTVTNPAYNPPNNPYRYRPDYPTVLSPLNICNYVNNLGVNEIWMYAYQGPSQLQIDESKMSGPNGDYSNEWYHDNLPVCAKTYTLMTYNYGRGTAEAVHSHGHQLEAELSAVDSTLFRTDFEGLNYPGGTSTVGRCGSVHNPPNATHEYDWADATAHASDCLAWNPDSVGPTTQISCANWGCTDISDTNNSQLNWQIYWMQNFPGKGNTVTYGGRPMRNWWDVHGDWDRIISSDRTLTLPATATLLSQSHPATASSVENSGLAAANAVDGNTGTRWSSTFTDPQWLQIDLGATHTISKVVLNWETAYATAYQIQTSTDATTWTPIYSTTTGTGGTQTLTVSGTGRYIRMYGTHRATSYGYSLWEFQVYGI